MLRRPDSPAKPVLNPTATKSPESAERLYTALHSVYARRFAPDAPIATPLAAALAAQAAFPTFVSSQAKPEAPPPPSQATQPQAPKILQTHLDYGSSGPSASQPAYRQNCMPYRRGPGRPKGLHFRSVKRLELIARLENAGIGEFAAATMLGISVPRLRTMKRSPDYLKARVAITHGLIIDQENVLADVKEQRKEILTQLLPPALRVIANAVSQPPTDFAERSLQVRVAQDILDREGTYAKISRSEIRPVDRFDWATQEHSAREVISIVRGSASVRSTCTGTATELEQQQLEVAKLVEITRAFAAGKTVSEGGAELASKILEMTVPPGAERLGEEESE